MQTKSLSVFMGVLVVVAVVITVIALLPIGGSTAASTDSAVTVNASTGANVRQQEDLKDKWLEHRSTTVTTQRAMSHNDDVLSEEWLRQRLAAMPTGNAPNSGGLLFEFQQLAAHDAVNIQEAGYPLGFEQWPHGTITATDSFDLLKQQRQEGLKDNWLERRFR